MRGRIRVSSLCIWDSTLGSWSGFFELIGLCLAGSALLLHVVHVLPTCSCGVGKVLFEFLTLAAFPFSGILSW